MVYNNVMSEPLLTVKEAAELIGVSTRTLRRWDYMGVLRSIRFPMGESNKRTIRRYRKEDIEKLYEQRYEPKKN